MSIWQSKRLYYRALEKEDETGILLKSSADSRAFLNAATWVPTPQSKEMVAEFREFLNKQLLKVIICLPKPKDDTSALDQAGASEDDELPDLEPIGWLCLANFDPREYHHRRSEIGITLLRKYRGQGYGSEAIVWSLEWGFQHAGLHRIAIRAFQYNERAHTLYRRLGFVSEGVNRDFLWHNGRYWDVHLLAMLESDWKEKYGKGIVDNTDE